MLVFLLLLLPELALTGFFTAGALLAYPAGSPSRADVVVVLGGDVGGRFTRARELVLAGYSRRVLLLHGTEAERKYAQDKLPGVDVQTNDLPLHSWHEARAVRALMQANGWRSVLVVSDPPHMLRLRYVWASNFRGTGLTYSLIATDPPWWPGWRWWRNRISREFVGSEVLKLGYYLLRYPLGFCVGGGCD